MALYLHLGELPASGKSVCWTLTRGTWGEGAWSDLDDDRRAEFTAAGYTVDDATVYEPGLSVFGLHFDCPDDEPELVFVVNDSDPDDVADWCERPAYLVRGEEIGRGFDGEPIVSVFEVIGRATAQYDRRRGKIAASR